MGDRATPGTTPAGPAWEPGGLLAGAIAAGAWGPVLGQVPTPAGAAVILSAGIAAGVLALASLILRTIGLAPDDGVIGALLGFLAWPVLARRTLDLVDVHLSPVLSQGLLLEGSAVAGGLVLLWMFAATRPGHRGGWWDPVHSVGAIAWGGAAGAFVLVLAKTGTPDPGASTVLAVAAATILVALLVQRGLARRSSERQLAALGSAPALVVAGAQLLDGVVSYLAVNDPLGVLETTFQEEVVLSAALLEATGPGYPLTKWAIALVFAYHMDGYEAHTDGTSVSRLGAYLLVTLLGLGPGLFSTTQLVL